MISAMCSMPERMASEAWESTSLGKQMRHGGTPGSHRRLSARGLPQMGRTTMNPRRDDAIRGAAARATADAYPNKKRYARALRVTTRTAQRHANPDDAKGSPAHRWGLFMDSCPNPARIVANARTYLYRSLRDLTRDELVAQIRDHYAEDGRAEGEDNATRFARGVNPLDRAAIHERDAGVDEWLAAAWREVAARGMTEADVLGGGA